MRYAVLAVALAATSSAHAINRQRGGKVVTITEYVDITTTITVDGAAATPSDPVDPIAVSSRMGFDFSNFRKKKSSSAVAKPSAVPSVVFAPSFVLPSSGAPSVAPASVAPSVVLAPSAIPASSVAASVAASVAPAPSVAPSVVVAPSVAPSVAPAPASSSAPTTPAPSNDYQNAVIYNHNVHRANHSAPAMAWSPSLAATALKIAQTCVYAHSTAVDGGGYGQNIAAGRPVNDIAFVITEQFYNGEVNSFVDYGQAQPADFTANFHNYGHFTQVVWVGSTTVGCASVDCTSSGLANVASNVPPIFHVCNYGPAGNVEGEFDTNVLPSLGQATVHAT
jgi:uncharacterized protein YkwD